MTRYHTFIDASTEIGEETINGILQNGSEFGVGISSELNVNGGLIVSGVSTLSVTSTSNLTVNSTLSFELISNTNLRIQVRGTDGVIRSADLTLS